jgi:uncharacterized membrane protein (UPF0127 family)
VNLTRDKLIAGSVKQCNSFIDRFFGLMFTRSLAQDSGLALKPCNSIHMFWMNYPIDAIFLDKDGIVVGLARGIKPWQVSNIFRQAITCIEVNVGTIEKTQTEPGDRIELS